LIPFLWLDAAALLAGSVVALLDLPAEIHGRKVGRPAFGVLVLAGLLAVYVAVVREGYVPLPGWVVIAFGFLYLPFLSSAFIDLDTTDRVAREQLEALLLAKDVARLRHASGHRVLVEGRRRLKVHWEVHGGVDQKLVVELDVHPSLWPLTVSRPHVAEIRDQVHLEYVRQEILRRRAGA
jgi:hypothetical protein